MRPLRKHLTREEVNDEEGDLEMAYSVAYQHTDGNRNHDGSNLVHGVKKWGLTENLSVPYSIYVTTACNTVLNPCDGA